MFNQRLQKNGQESCGSYVIIKHYLIFCVDMGLMFPIQLLKVSVMIVC
jgi:hypothetical protein